MGASVQSRGGGKKRSMNADINVVPYIDVMLVLLIIFMVTAPLMTQGVDVDLPDAEAESMTVSEDPPILQILADGSYKFGEESLSEDALAAKAQELAQTKPDQMLLVYGDRKVPYEYVVRGMSIVRNAGVTKIGFITETADETAGKTKR